MLSSISNKIKTHLHSDNSTPANTPTTTTNPQQQAYTQQTANGPVTTTTAPNTTYDNVKLQQQQANPVPMHNGQTMNNNGMNTQQAPQPVTAPAAEPVPTSIKTHTNTNTNAAAQSTASDRLQGIMTVTILQAENLPKMDYIGQNDNYCVVELLPSTTNVSNMMTNNNTTTQNGQQQQLDANGNPIPTKEGHHHHDYKHSHHDQLSAEALKKVHDVKNPTETIQRTQVQPGKNPIWNEKMCFPVPRGNASTTQWNNINSATTPVNADGTSVTTQQQAMQPQQPFVPGALRVSVWDSDYNSHDLVGAAVVPLTADFITTSQQGMHIQWVDLTNPSAKSHNIGKPARICIVCHFVPESMMDYLAKKYDATQAAMKKKIATAVVGKIADSAHAQVMGYITA